MKKLLLLLLLSAVFTAELRSQNWFSADHHWTFNISGGFIGVNYEIEMVAAADTVIHGQNARKWVFDYPYSPSYLERFTYSDGPRAYYFDVELDSFVKMYDFSLPVGAQIQVPRPFGVFTYQIDSIDVVQAGDLTLKRQRAHYINPNGQPSNWKFDILENIGMVGSPFDVNYPTCGFVFLHDFECGSAVDGFDIKFLCFSSSAGIFNPFSSECSAVGTYTPGNTSFQLHPNPASHSFQIQLNDNTEVQSMVLTDGQRGKMLRSWVGPQASYNLEGLPAGLYFATATFSNGSKAVKKLVKFN